MAFRSVPTASDATSPLSCVPLPILHPINASASATPSPPTTKVTGPVLMPWVGYGTYRLGRKQARSAALSALRSGYHHIDTAFVYGGQTAEIEVGKAISDALQHGIIKSRREIFVTTKHWREYHGYDASLKCLEMSLERLGLEYVDCWMMHWPGPCWESKERQLKETDKQTGKRALDDDQGNDLWSRAKSGMGQHEIVSLRAETWRAMEDAYKSGKVRSIAVSNFAIQHLETLKQSATLWPPAVNQIELHPYYPQRELVEYCRNEGIVVQAYASLGGQDGTKAKWKVLGGKLLESPAVLAASKRLPSPQRKITPAQILLRWALQQNIAVVPKTASPLRMVENANLFDFELTDTDMAEISKLGDNVDGDEGRICWRTEPLRMLDFE